MRRKQLIEINEVLDCHIKNIEAGKKCATIEPSNDDGDVEDVNESFSNMDYENIADSSLENMANFGDDNEQYETI